MIVEKDLLFMEKYLKEFGNVSSFAGKDEMLKSWYTNKSELRKLFNNNLTYSFVYSSENNEFVNKEIKSKIEDLYIAFNEKFYSNFYKFYYNIILNYKTKNRASFYLGTPFKSNRLAYNYTYNNHTIPAGTKFFKAIMLIAKEALKNKEIDESTFIKIKEEIEKTRLEYSKINNEKAKILKETIITLSIHPLDYITMSDNNYDWDSCMSIINDGCYKVGTLEMMNSPCVIVAYVAGKHPFTPFDDKTLSWNNKKWRELFIVTPELISGVKGYPYEFSEAEKAIINELKKLAEKAWNVKYNETFYSPKETEVTFNTNNMYNDFGNNYTSLIFNKNYSPSTPLIINYGIDSICPECGHIKYDNEANELTCCDYTTFYCDECGKQYDEEELINVKKENHYLSICKDCFNKNYSYSFIDDTVYPIEELITINYNSCLIDLTISQFEPIKEDFNEDYEYIGKGRYKPFFSYYKDKVNE